jgi:ferric-dicitrate binding protein FerR (iron transport regulator)
LFRDRNRIQEIRRVEGAAGDAISWQSGLLRFDDHTLVEAAAVVNRYSKDQIVVRSPVVSGLNVSGQFPAGDAQRFADTVAEMHGLRAVRQATQIELVPAD